MKSTLKWFKNEKGYVFIEYKGNDILIHYCSFREQEEEIIELTKTDTGYKLKNIEQKEEVA